MYDIFISHVEEDADIALEIALGLEEAGYKTWFYEVDSIPGPVYLAQVGEAIELSHRLVERVLALQGLGIRPQVEQQEQAHWDDARQRVQLAPCEGTAILGGELCS